MKYDLQAPWLYDMEIDPASKRLAALLRSKYFGGCVIKPKSLKLAPTAKNIRDVIASQIRLPPARIDAVGQYNTKSLNLTVDVTPPCGVSRFPSSVQVTFSLGQTFAGGPFANVNDLRDLTLACAKVGPCPMTFFNPRDINHGARLEVIRTTDTWAVPAAIEWITVLHQSIVDNMAVDLMKVETVPGVRAGRKGDFWWITLTPYPFQGNSTDLQIQEQVAHTIALPAIHARFPRRCTA